MSDYDHDAIWQRQQIRRAEFPKPPSLVSCEYLLWQQAEADLTTTRMEMERLIEREHELRTEYESCLARDAAHRPAMQDYQARLVELQAEHARLVQELAHWKTCSMCGEQMEQPGYCSRGESERVQGLEQMHDETLTRAEQAEARLAAVREAAQALPETVLRGSMLTVLDLVESRGSLPLLAEAPAPDPLEDPWRERADAEHDQWVHDSEADNK